MVAPQHCKGKVRSTVKLVLFWNSYSNRGNQVQEVIKKIPFGVSKMFPVRRAEWVVADWCWKCLLTDTGHDSWHATFNWSVSVRSSSRPAFLGNYRSFIYLQYDVSIANRGTFSELCRTGPYINNSWVSIVGWNFLPVEKLSRLTLSSAWDPVVETNFKRMLSLWGEHSNRDRMHRRTIC